MIADIFSCSPSQFLPCGICWIFSSVMSYSSIGGCSSLFHASVFTSWLQNIFLHSFVQQQNGAVHGLELGSWEAYRGRGKYLQTTLMCLLCQAKRIAYVCFYLAVLIMLAAFKTSSNCRLGRTRAECLLLQFYWMKCNNLGKCKQICLYWFRSLSIVSWIIYFCSIDYMWIILTILVARQEAKTGKQMMFSKYNGSQTQNSCANDCKISIWRDFSTTETLQTPDGLISLRFWSILPL